MDLADQTSYTELLVKISWQFAGRPGAALDPLFHSQWEITVIST